MCFSAPASFTAGIMLSSLGVLAIRKVEQKKDLPLASVPVFFGIHQIIEGFVWLSFQNSSFNTLFTYLFVLFAYVFWPIYIPFTILSLEQSGWRRKVLWGFQIIGIISAGYLLYDIISTPVASFIVKNSICYSIPNISLPVGILYLAALCLGHFFSSNTFIKVLGVFGVVSLLIAYFFYTETYASVWCFFAAIISGSIYWYLSSRNKFLRKDVSEK